MNDDELSRVRAEVDALDRRLVALVAEREQLVRRAGRLKADTAAVRAPARVEQVIARVRGVAGELGADPGVVEATYRAMVAAFIGLELAQHAGDELPAPVRPSPSEGTAGG